MISTTQSFLLLMSKLSMFFQYTWQGKVFSHKQLKSLNFGRFSETVELEKFENTTSIAARKDVTLYDKTQNLYSFKLT